MNRVRRKFIRAVSTSIDIDASVDTVWRVLTDFERYPIWNSFIKRATGILQEGGKLRLSMVAPGLFSRSVEVNVTRVQAQSELRWLGHWICPGFLDGDHKFNVVRLSERKVRLIHSETFQGLLVPLVGPQLERGMETAFGEMNRLLKEEAERRVVIG